jgi:hypothetical protein
VALVIEELGATMWRSLNQNVLPIYGPITFWEIPSFLKTVGCFLPFPRSSWDLKTEIVVFLSSFNYISFGVVHVICTYGIVCPHFFVALGNSSY